MQGTHTERLTRAAMAEELRRQVAEAEYRVGRLQERLTYLRRELASMDAAAAPAAALPPG